MYLNLNFVFLSNRNHLHRYWALVIRHIMSELADRPRAVVLIHRRAVPHQLTITYIPFPPIYFHIHIKKLECFCDQVYYGIARLTSLFGRSTSRSISSLSRQVCRVLSLHRHSPSFRPVVSDHPLWNAPPSGQESHQSRPKKMRAVKAQPLHHWLHYTDLSLHLHAHARDNHHHLILHAQSLEMIRS